MNEYAAIACKYEQVETGRVVDAACIVAVCDER